MGLPDFICIGAHKAATTWLSRNLSRHPDIWLPFTKELHFFDPPVDGSARYWRRLLTSKLESGIARAREKGNAARLAYLEGLKGEDFILTEAWYRKVFAPKPEGKITGDFTPPLCDPAGAGDRQHAGARPPGAVHLSDPRSG